MSSTVSHRVGALATASTLLAALLIATLALPATAAGPKVQWTRQFGTGGTDLAMAVDVDRVGRAYVGGITGGTFPGQTYHGEVDAYIRKYKPGGAVVWTRMFGTAGDDFTFDVAVHRKGRAYAVGMTDGTLPGQVNHGDNDAFIRAYRPNGVAAWTRQFGTPGVDQASAAAVDGKGRIYVAGTTEGILPGQAGHGGADAFVRRYKPKGGVAWTRQFGSGGSDAARGIAIDRKGRIYVVGSTTGTLGGGPNMGGADMFVRKYRPNGAVAWTRTFGSAGNDHATTVAVDRLGRIIVAGSTEGAFPGYVNKGHSDIILRKYRPNGSVAWTRQFGTAADEEPSAVTFDKGGRAYLVGTTEGALPGQTSKGSTDGFVRKYRPNGSVAWTRQFGTNQTDLANGGKIDPSGHLVVAGATAGKLPGQPSKGLMDGYVRKYR